MVLRDEGRSAAVELAKWWVVAVVLSISFTTICYLFLRLDLRGNLPDRSVKMVARGSYTEMKISLGDRRRMYGVIGSDAIGRVLVNHTP